MFCLFTPSSKGHWIRGRSHRAAPRASPVLFYKPAHSTVVPAPESSFCSVSSAVSVLAVQPPSWFHSLPSIFPSQLSICFSPRFIIPSYQLLLVPVDFLHHLSAWLITPQISRVTSGHEANQARKVPYKMFVVFCFFLHIEYDFQPNGKPSVWIPLQCGPFWLTD